MALFSRFRRASTEPLQGPAPVAEVLPAINQRVSVSRAGQEPVPTRVDDEDPDGVVIASPNMPLSEGDPIVVTWESEDGWFSFESTVKRVDEVAPRPTVTVDRHGRVTRFNNRRSDIRRDVTLPIELRVVVARVVKPGRTLNTQTVELGGNAVRFATSAPFAPGDVLESTIMIRDGEKVLARLKIIRVDSVSGSWRQTCTALFDDILISDRTRIVSFLESVDAPADPGLRSA